MQKLHNNKLKPKQDDFSVKYYLKFTEQLIPIIPKTFQNFEE